MFLSPYIEYVIYIIFDEPDRKEKFDKNKWMNDEQNRYRMEGDMINSKMLIGKTQQQVLELLGNEKGKITIRKEFLTNMYYQVGYIPKPELFNINIRYLVVSCRDDTVNGVYVAEYD